MILLIPNGWMSDAAIYEISQIADVLLRSICGFGSTLGGGKSLAKLNKGTPATKEFYDRVGWQREDGTLVDTHLFGWQDGPIRRTLEVQRRKRLLEAMGGPNQRLVELGCGGTPAVFLARSCSKYTGVDFSNAGLVEAATALEDAGVLFETVEADITALPFENGAFDVVYSAHAIYHIDKAEGQATAFKEAMRVLRPGGRAIFVLSNPFPLLFPVRLLRRVLAVTPYVNAALNRFRSKPPLPYLPLPLGWMKAELKQYGDVEITGHALPSIAFDRSVSDTKCPGRLIWRAVHYLETHQSTLSARLGCYVLIVVRKTSVASPL